MSPVVGALVDAFTADSCPRNETRRGCGTMFFDACPRRTKKALFPGPFAPNRRGSNRQHVADSHGAFADFFARARDLFAFA